MSPIGSRLRSAREVYYSSTKRRQRRRCRHGAQLGAGLALGLMGQVMLQSLGVRRAASSTCCGQLPDPSRPGGRSWDRRR